MVPPTEAFDSADHWKFAFMEADVELGVTKTINYK